ncbi:PAS domain S-box protein [Haloferax larsenii]|uniref:histidine kinase n=1 Tax=Haloferax larsenii TaxID=302484 RepID=A0A1H7VBG9_HALLR|nr:PAS domain S-box protein [Haloferax larsenii]SEM06583.1 PAS domain S-box-containing protein [Haloferax larsenii]
MSRHTEQLVGALFNVLKTEGHTEAQQRFIESYQSHAPAQREELVATLVSDFVSIIQDYLTPQERADVFTATVEYLREQFLSVIEVAPVAIIVVAEDGSVQLWNTGAERIFGWTETEFLTESYSRMLAELPDTFETYFSQLQRGERLTGIETRHRHKNGSTLDVRLWAAPVYTTGDTPTGATFVISDITAQKQREQRLTILNRVLRHNIRNDITVLRGHLDLLADQVSDGNKHVEAMEKRLVNIESLSESARHIEQLQARDDEESLTTFELGAELQNHLDRLELDWPAAEIQSNIRAGTTIEAHELFPYALDNLIENAVEHNDSEIPRVFVETSFESESSQYVALAIGDNGPGLPKVEREVLTRETETDLMHSAGMGLWLTRWIIRSSGGELAVEPSQWDGTRIVLKLRTACPSPDDE